MNNWEKNQNILDKLLVTGVVTQEFKEFIADNSNKGNVYKSYTNLYSGTSIINFLFQTYGLIIKKSMSLIHHTVTLV